MECKHTVHFFNCPGCSKKLKLFMSPVNDELFYKYFPEYRLTSPDEVRKNYRKGG